MALPAILRHISKRAATAAPLIESAVGRGLSRNATRSMLQDAGFGIRRQDMLDLYRYFETGEVLKRSFRNIRKDLMPNPSRMLEAVNPIRAAYSYKFKIEAFDTKLKETVERNVTVSSDILLTPAQAEEKALKLVMNKEKYERERPQLTLENIIKAGIRGILGE